MIKIDRHKVNCPLSLDISNEDLVENDYKHDDVIDALFEIQHEKCCYCEKDLIPLGKTARWVEHVVARTDARFRDANGNTNWNEANAWGNLLYSCSTCNRNKGATPAFDSNGRRNLIDPSYSGIDPEDHVGFLINGFLLKYEERTGLGKDTIEILKLDERDDFYSGFRIAKLELDACFGELVNALIDGKTSMAESKRATLRRMSSAHLLHASFRRKYIMQRVDSFNNNELPGICLQFSRKIKPITVDIANGHEVII